MILRGIVFLLAFTLEVRVHAASLITLASTDHPIQIPENCLIESSLCTVRTLSREKFRLEVSAASVTLDQQSSFMRLSAQSGALVQGRIWVSTGEQFTLETPYGSILSNGGEWLALREKDRVLVQSLKGDVRLHPRGHAEPIRLAVGSELWMGKVTSKGLSSVGIPKPFSLDSIMAQWAPLFDGGKSKFVSRLKELKSDWIVTVEDTSITYSTLVQRELASQENERVRQEQSRQAWEKERAHWRKILWEKTFE